MKISVLIAEDDPDMRYVLKKVVEEVEGVKVTGEAGDGTEAIKLFKELSPRVVFVDIGLPGKTGVELAREIFDINPRTFIVFATALSGHREEAFDVYAFDYLVKPFKMNRVRQTMERIKMALSGKIAGEPAPDPAGSDDVINKMRKQFFRSGSRIVYLNLDEIIYITKEGHDSIIHYTGGKIETKENLNVLEKQLGGYPFFRSHSGFLVNLKMVKELIPSGRSSFELVMAGTLKRPLMTVEKFKELGEISHTARFKKKEKGSR